MSALLIGATIKAILVAPPPGALMFAEMLCVERMNFIQIMNSNIIIVKRNESGWSLIATR